MNLLFIVLAFWLWMDGVNWKVCAPGSSLVNEDFKELVIRLSGKKIILMYILTGLPRQILDRQDSGLDCLTSLAALTYLLGSGWFWGCLTQLNNSYKAKDSINMYFTDKFAFPKWTQSTPLDLKNYPTSSKYGVNWKVCAPGSALVNEDFREMVIKMRGI